LASEAVSISFALKEINEEPKGSEYSSRVRNTTKDYPSASAAVISVKPISGD